MKEDEFHPRIIAKGFYLEQTVEFLRSEVSPAWLRYELLKLGIAGIDL